MTNLNLLDLVCEHIETNEGENIIILTSVSGNGRRLLKQCAKEKSLLGVKTHTFISLAKEICGENLYSASGSKLQDENQLKELFFQCVKEIADTDESAFINNKFFKERSTAEMLKEIILELNANKVDGFTSNNSVCNSRKKAIDEVRNAYVHKKEEKGVWDKNDLLMNACDCIANSKLLKNTCIIALEDSIRTEVEKEFIKNLGEQCKVVDLSAISDIEIEENNNIHFYKCRSIEVEERFIIRDILEKKRRVEDCVVVYLSSEYASGLLATAQLFGINISMQGGIPFAQNKFYNLYKALKNWRHSDYSADELYNLIYNRVLPMKRGWDFCQILHEYNVGWGKDRYKQVLDFIESVKIPEAKVAQASNEELDAKQKLTLKVESAIPAWKDALALYIAVAENSGDIESQKKNLLDVLKDVNKQDPAAYGIIKKAIRNIEIVEKNENVLDLLLKQLENTNYLASTDDKGRLLCLPLNQSLFTGRKYLYICGMSRFALQSGVGESPLLLDEEKKEMGIRTQIDREKLSENLIRRLLSESYEEVNVSYNAFDTDKMIELQPAPLFKKLGGLKPIFIDYRAKYENEGENETKAEDALILGDFIKKDAIEKFEKLDKVSLPDSVIDKYGKTIELTDKIKGNHSAFVTEYPNFIREKVFSPSALESALNCPLKYYLQKVLRLQPYKTPQKTDDTWLTSSEVGTMVHDTLEKYYSSLNGKVAVYDKCLADRLLDEVVQKFKNERPSVSDSIMNDDIDKARQLVKVAIDWTFDNGYTKVNKVIATELGFGEKYTGRETKVLIYEDPNVNKKYELSINGKIDRVDEWIYEGNTITAVVDYKTGGKSGDKFKGDKEKTKVQPFIYALAVEKELPKTQVGESGYLFLNEENAELISISQDDRHRKIKGALIFDLVWKWLSDEKNVLTRCAAFDIDENGHIKNKGIDNVPHTKSAKDACYCTTCEFKDFCTEFFQEHGLGDSYNYGKD